jgi:hypothetical protein
MYERIISFAFVMALGSLILGGSSPATLAEPTDVGYRDFSFGTAASAPTAEKPQSKLWFNDGIWWGSLWNSTSRKWEIYRFDWVNHAWSTTGTPIEARSNSKADTLWDGTHLYVATAPRSTGSTDQNAYVRRYSYDKATKTYALDPGFPATVASGVTEAIVLDKDTTGKLWVTFTQGSKVYVNRSLNSDSSWGTPFVPPVQGTSVDPDDISAVIAFDHNPGGTPTGQIGVMWSNQTNGNMYFATHRDGDPDDVWQTSQVAFGGPNYADDHISLKSLHTDSSGRVFAAIKTSLTNSTQPLVVLLILHSDGKALHPNGTWTNHVFGTVADDHTRPIVIIDEESRELYMFATAPVSGGTIYYKKTNLEDISFPTSRGTPFIKSSTDTAINNPTSTKQNASNATGILLIASDDGTDRYLHNTISLGGGDTTPPETAIDSGPTGTVGSASASFAFSSTEAGSTFECSLDGAAFSSCTSPEEYTSLAEGNHTFEVRAIDAAGNTDSTPAKSTWTVDKNPTVTSVIPIEGKTGVPRNTNVTVTFSEEMDASTIVTDPSAKTSTTVKLFKVNADGSKTQVPAEVSCDDPCTTVTLNPYGTSSTLLGTHMKYEATVTTSATDLNGNPLDQNPNTSGNQAKVWRFKTGG